MEDVRVFSIEKLQEMQKSINGELNLRQRDAFNDIREAIQFYVDNFGPIPVSTKMSYNFHEGTIFNDEKFTILL